MSEYDIALDKQVEWASFWTSDYGLQLFDSIGQAISRKRAEAGERDSDLVIEGRHDEAVLEIMPLINGECFYWSRDMIDLVTIAANSLPDNWFLMKQHIPAASGFFWLAKEPRIEVTGLCAFGWTLLSKGRDGVAAIHIPQEGGTMPEFDQVAIITFIDNPDFPAPIPTLNHIDVGQTLNDWRLRMSDLAVSLNEDPRHLKEEYDSLRLFAVMLSFIQQRIMTLSRLRASRATRRRTELSRRTEPDINIVKLRRIVHPSHKGEGVLVEWNCQWIVRGHWRDQWYPSIRRNQPIWITPYIKGPEDKPLRNPGRLFAVVR